MIRSRCPYCESYNENNFRITKDYSNKRSVICPKCEAKYNISISTNVREESIKGELEKVIPKDVIDMVINTVTKFLDWTGPGGYEKSRTIKVDSKYRSYYSYNSNAYVISLSASATYYSSKYRTVTFYIKPGGKIEHEVRSEFTWRENSCFKGETLDEKVFNYIDLLLVKWVTI